MVRLVASNGDRCGGVVVSAPALSLEYSRFASPAAIAPHLHLVGLTLLAVVLLRLTVTTLLPARLSRFLAALGTTSALFSIALYYALVLIGLRSWGRVLSWDLFTSYLQQLPDLAASLGIAFVPALVVAVILYLGLFAAVFLYLRKYDWINPFSRRVSKSTIGALLICGVALVAIQVAEFLSLRWTLQSEPVSLTLFPVEASRALEGNAIDLLSAEKLGRENDTARSAYRVDPSAEKRNLILIVVDALRPDHLGPYAYPRATTPHLDALDAAGRIRKLTNVHASCGDSACGLLGLASSRFVHEFSDRPFVLQEVLKRYGYRVHMILSGDHTNFYDLKKIYGPVDSYYDGADARAYYKNNDQLVLDRLATFPAWDGAPTMMQFHLMSAHVARKHRNMPPVFAPEVNYILPGDILSWASRSSNAATTNFYDKGVLEADRIIDQLLKMLETKNYLRNSLVVITADHGESLGEFGLFAHANSVHEQVLKIPLLMLAYGYSPARPVGRRAFPSQVDIAPTILAEFGMPAPENWSGRPLQETAGPEFTYFKEHSEAGLLDHRDAGHVWKYWTNSRTREEFAFDLSVDADESRNAIATVPAALASEWRQRILRTLSAEPPRD